MRKEATRHLDRIDMLPVGSGLLEASMFARGGVDGGSAGAAVDYSHRLSESLSVFGEAEAGVHYGHASELYYQGLLGIRKRF